MKQHTETLERVRVSVDIEPGMHADMRELAKRKRVLIGVVYDEAIKLYLQRTENYLGKRKEKQNGYR